MNVDHRREQAMFRLVHAMLTQSGLDPSDWGQASGSKTLADLVTEIEQGEIRLQLMRTTSVVRIDVRYKDGDQGKEYQLYEHSQEYFVTEMPVDVRRSSGNWEVSYVRDRCTPDNQWAIWEKQKPGESFKQSALRALTKEELQLTGEITMLDQGQFEYVEPPIDYPGLETYLRGASFVVYLSKEQFEALRAGHTEVQERKQNHFKWREL